MDHIELKSLRDLLIKLEKTFENSFNDEIKIGVTIKDNELWISFSGHPSKNEIIKNKQIFYWIYDENDMKRDEQELIEEIITSTKKHFELI